MFLNEATINKFMHTLMDGGFQLVLLRGNLSLEMSAIVEIVLLTLNVGKQSLVVISLGLIHRL